MIETKEKLLDKANKKGLFNDIICPNCGKPNNIKYKQEKINGSGIWYYCQFCEFLDVIGWDIIKDCADNKI